MFQLYHYKQFTETFWNKSSWTISYLVEFIKWLYLTSGPSITFFAELTITEWLHQFIMISIVNTSPSNTIWFFPRFGSSSSIHELGTPLTFVLVTNNESSKNQQHFIQVPFLHHGLFPFVLNLEYIFVSIPAHSISSSLRIWTYQKLSY